MKLIASAVLALCTAAPAYAANTFACQNVKDYGALGNNATDDTAAVKSAFTAAAAGTIVENGTTISKGLRVFPGRRVCRVVDDHRPRSDFRVWRR